MDKKTFKKVTTKIYEEYGFIKQGKYYYLNLDDVVICSGFSSMYGVTYLAYNIRIKAIHSADELKLNNMFDGYDSTENEIYFNKDSEGYHKREIRFDVWSEEYYATRLMELLHYYFDPYKQDALNHIRKCYKEIGFVHQNERMLIKGEAKKYLED